MPEALTPSSLPDAASKKDGVLSDNRITRAATATALILGTAIAWADLSPLRHHEAAIDVGGQRYTVHIPDGYVLETLAAGLDGPRLLTFAENADLFVGSKSGAIYRLAPPYTKAEVLAKLNGYPHSIDFRKDEILIARSDALYRADFAPGSTELSPAAVTLLAKLPAGGGHSSRTVRVGPDGRVYIGLGISGNCSDQYLGGDYAFDDRRGGILVLDEDVDPPQWRTFASGLRNPVGFDWHPASGVMYASNNGPDHWGFELPPEYFSRVDNGSFHGMPWYQYDGKQILRDRCIASPPPRPRSQVQTPVVTFPARNAPMAVVFVPSGALEPALEHDALVALRGSWATQPFGRSVGDPASRREPKIVAVRFEDGKARRVDDLVTGFQAANGERWARPVGLAIGPDGALYFTSDSGANAVFRLRREAAS